MRKRCSLVANLAVLVLLASNLNAQTQGSVEDVQIRSIDFSTQVLELHNFGTVTRAMDGWRFCTHDEVNILRYSASTGMNGLSLAPGESLFVHWNNDATGAGTINRSTIGGGWISDLNADAAGTAVSIGIYRSGGFANANNLNDHVQYSFGGAHVSGATPRGGVAVTAGLWTASTDWISVDENSLGIELNADPFPGAGAAHGPSSYNVIVPLSEEVTPDSGTIISGSLAAGSPADLAASDNVDWSVRRNPASIQSIATVEIKGMTTIAAPVSLEFTYESSVFARGPVTQTISLFNYDTDNFEQVDSRTASRFIDGTVMVVPSGDLSRFVQPGTGCVEARIRYQGNQSRLVFTANMDQAIWTIGR